MRGIDAARLRRFQPWGYFQVAPPVALRQRLGALVGGRVALDVDLAKVNEPVKVAAPADPLPASALGKG